MKRNIFSSFLVFVILFSMFQIPFSQGVVTAAPETEGTVISESDLTWLDLGDGKARITGYSGDETHNLIIPETVDQGQLTVTELGAEKSFGSNSQVFNNKGLTGSITIPDGVKMIGRKAFQNNKLTTVIIPNSVTTIASEAFDNNKITAISIPDSVTSIGSEAFKNNSFESLCDLELPSHLDYFYLDYRLYHIIEMAEEFVIPSQINGEAVTEVPEISGWDIKSITVPATVTNIGAYDFDLGNFYHLERVIFLREGTDWTIDEDVFASDPGPGGGGMGRDIPDTFEIVGHPGSTAETFADEKGITFVDVSTITVPTNPTCGEETAYDPVAEANKATTYSEMRAVLEHPKTGNALDTKIVELFGEGVGEELLLLFDEMTYNSLSDTSKDIIATSFLMSKEEYESVEAIRNDFNNALPVYVLMLLPTESENHGAVLLSLQYITMMMPGMISADKPLNDIQYKVVAQHFIDNQPYEYNDIIPSDVIEEESLPLFFGQYISTVEPLADVTVNKGKTVTIDYSEVYPNGTLTVTSEDSSISVSNNDEESTFDIKGLSETTDASITITYKDSKGVELFSGEMSVAVAGMIYGDGDGNGDGIISPADVYMLTQFLNGKITLSEAQQKALDINGDGNLDQADLLLVMRAYLAS